MTYKSVRNHTTLEGPGGTLVEHEYEKRTVVGVTFETNKAGDAVVESETYPRSADYRYAVEITTVSESKVPIGERFFNGPIPDDLAELQSWGSLGQTTVWITGEFVTLQDASIAHWDGTDWVVGAAPAVTMTGATAGIPGVFTPAGAPPPDDITALQTADPTADPLTAWTTGQHVILDDASLAHWDSAAWVAGAAP